MLFRNRPDVLARYQKRWKFINIDEYQDTDHVQYTIANLLAKLHSNICVVGDVDQSIYSFRGADFRNILQFEEDWPETRTITLEENYRSVKPILDAANAIIVKNVFRKPKNLFTKKERGEKLELLVANTENEESEYVAQKTKNLLEEGAEPHSIAVLFRTNAQSRILEEKFLALQIPYHVVGIKFYARKEIKDVLAYLRASLNRNDLISIKRIINVPTRGIGKGLSAKYLAKSVLTETEKKRIHGFEILLSDIKKMIMMRPASKTIELLFKKSGYLEMFSPEIEEDMMHLGNIKEFLTLSRRFDNLKPPQGIIKLLEEAVLMSAEDSMSDKTKSVEELKKKIRKKYKKKYGQNNFKVYKLN
ncbi:MAG: UvrD-helicase domain-containing protein [Bacteroidetes bacterium]|nr:UvrD-helicase domain-containing protein [Bacteroidota bacterium]